MDHKVPENMNRLPKQNIPYKILVCVTKKLPFCIILLGPLNMSKSLCAKKEQTDIYRNIFQDRKIHFQTFLILIFFSL